METTLFWCIWGHIFIYYLTHALESCSHDDRRIEHGEHFISRYLDLSSETPGFCTLCNCQNGVVVCQEVSCSYLNCDGRNIHENLCCKQCTSHGLVSESIVEERRQTSGVMLMPTPVPLKTRKKGECLSDGKIYKDGASWQPTIGPLGTMSCVQCDCKNGAVSCGRFQCRELPCSHPRKKFGHCCPVCPDLETLTGGNVRCLPRSSEVFVFKRPKMGKTADVIEYGFIQSGARNKLEVHTWDTAHPGEGQFNTLTLFKTAIAERNLTITGATSSKHWNRFMKREKRLKGRCLANCAERVVRLEETLKLYPLTSRARCRSDEIDTATL